MIFEAIHHVMETTEQSINLGHMGQPINTTKVVLSQHRNPGALRFALLLTSGICIIGGGLLALYLKDSWLLVGVWTSLFLSVSFIIYRFLVRYRTGAVQGDTLILKNLKNKSFVTPICSVRKVRSYTLFGLPCTWIRYKIDGHSHTTLLIGRPPGISVTVENHITHPIFSEKIKKANL